MKLSLLVIKTADPEALKKQYECLGLSFEYHNHGKGPWHYTTEIGGTVFEIYPLPKSSEMSDSTTRLGFEVEDIHNLIPQLKYNGWEIVKEPTSSPWGFRAVIKDTDGRKIELTEAEND